MRGAFAVRQEGGDDLYSRIGAFLAAQGLSPEPAHYSFAHGVLSDPTGPLAAAVDRLTDGGVRLSRSDITSLGGEALVGRPAASPSAPTPAPAPPPTEDASIKLVAETQAQVDGFATMMREMHDETRGFGRDLAESAAAIHQGPRIDGIDEIARLTGAMLTRIRDAERRLAKATTETDALREKLAEANDTARRDPLTGMPNRRAFDEAFAARDPAAAPYCLAVCDIDRFKRINDMHGHAVGDRVLRAIGRTLSEECPGHLVVRHGGEEFAILLAGADLADAAAHLDKVRALISAKRFRTRDSDKPLGQITLSVGVTAVRSDENEAVSFARADALLYAAKADGRDRVCAA